MINLFNFRNKNILIFFSILLFFFIIFFFLIKNESRKDLGDIVVPIEGRDVEFLFEEEDIKKENDKIIANLTYPVFLNQDSVKQLVSAQVKDYVDKLLFDFEERESEYDKFFDAKSTLDVSFDKITYSGKILSVTFFISEYSSGSAHPYTYKNALNFDINTGKILKNEDIFIKDGYLEYLSVSVDNTLSQFLVSKGWEQSDWFLDGIAPLEENYQNYYFDKDKIIFIFNPYQIMAYVYGIIEAPIFVSEINSIIKDEYGK